MPPETTLRPRPPRPRLWGRIPSKRRGEFLFGIGSIVIAVTGLLVVGGFVPGVFASSPVVFSETAPVCPTPAGYGTIHNLELPAWAHVHVSWVAVAPVPAFVYFQVAPPGLAPFAYSAAGNNGSGSFQSLGGSYTFSPLFGQYYDTPPKDSECETAVLTITVTYSPM